MTFTFMKLLHSLDLQILNFIQNIEQQYIIGAEVPCFMKNEE